MRELVGVVGCTVILFIVIPPPIGDSPCGLSPLSWRCRGGLVAPALCGPDGFAPEMPVSRGMLGHKSAKVTLDTYADLFDTDLDAVASALALKCAQTAPSRHGWSLKCCLHLLQ